MKVVAFDPGDTTGWAVVESTEDRKLVICSIGEDRRKTLFDKLRNLLTGTDIVVIEEFLIRPEWVRRGAFDNSRLETLRIIGAIEYEASRLSVPAHFQSPSIKTAGYAWIGQKNQHKHAMDAVVHGNYYLQKRNLVVR